jgi:Spy/CpxP family protein refolding chaperone
MSKVRAWGVALLGMALAFSATPASAQYYKPEPAMSGNWLRDLFWSPPQPEVHSVELIQPTTKAERAIDQQELLKTLHRRQDVCLRLLEIAGDTNNKALENEATRLDILAFQVYQAQSRKLTPQGRSTVVPVTARLATDGPPTRDQVKEQPATASSNKGSSEGKR